MGRGVAAEDAGTKPTFHANLKAASEAAAADQSLVLLIFGAEWCGPCQALKKNTLSAPEFLAQAGAVRIAEVDVDANEKEARQFGVESIPALFLLTAEGKIIARSAGYLPPAELLQWLQQGRKRMSAGEWEGTAPGSKLDAFIAKAASDGLDKSDIEHLLAMLDDPDPASRSAVGKLIVAQREAAVPPLIGALQNPYLGIRVAAVELLRRLAPQAPAIDPWQSTTELQPTIDALQKWWASTGKLPPPGKIPSALGLANGSIKSALDALRGNDPLGRTDAMSTLVTGGMAILPDVRDAIRQCERDGDHHAISLLEDVRWAILVPDALERRTGGVRNALARGASLERQNATARLGKAGREAMDALAELANDSDSLVVESAVRALSSVGGEDAIASMALLLKAEDSNIRMTAAQALGHMKRREANPYLLPLFSDTNEVVACTALGAIEEANVTESYSPNKKPVDPEIVSALGRSLGDTRWRVRAATAEVIGKLNASELKGGLTNLLNDADGFVAKSGLAALGKLNAIPPVEQLAALAKRLPGLRADVVKSLAELHDEQSISALTAMFDGSNTEGRLVMLNALLPNRDHGHDETDESLKPLLSRALAEKDPRLRRAAMDLAKTLPTKGSVDLVGPLLSDESLDSRVVAAGMILNILGEPPNRNGLQIPRSVVSFGSAKAANEEAGNKSNAASKEQQLAWHKTLLTHVDKDPDIVVAAAILATGDGHKDLPLFKAALAKADEKAIKRLAERAAIAAVLPKITLPEGREVLETMTHSPVLFAFAAGESARATPPVAEYLLEPARFRSVIEPADKQDIVIILPQLLENDQSGWSLLKSSERTTAIISALLQATNAAWRAAAIYALDRTATTKNPATFEPALHDMHPDVRIAATKAFTRAAKDSSALETSLGPLLADKNEHVAVAAAWALLQPEVRDAVGQQWEYESFDFEGVRVAFYNFRSTSNERPLATLDSKPKFLADTRAHLNGAKREDAALFALLLAQYGEFDGLDKLMEAKGAQTDNEDEDRSDALLVGVELSHNAKYLPYLRGLLKDQQGRHSDRPQKILRAMRGMTGPEARAFRLEVNKRIRATGVD